MKIRLGASWSTRFSQKRVRNRISLPTTRAAMKLVQFVLFVASFLVFDSLAQHVLHGHSSVGIATQAHSVGNSTIAGTDKGCRHRSNYFVNHNTKFQMCTGQTDQDLKNGMSIINLINSRGFLPTCRVMQLMLWMGGTVNERGYLGRELFVDVGANIGSCSVHMAALGFPVVSVEPVQQHVDTIRGSIEINPSFHIDLHHIGLSSEDRQIRANFGHGARNWGASEFHEVGHNDSFEAELKLRTLEHVVGHRRVALLKVDCEGCEWETIKSAKRMLRRIPMIKMELVQNEYTAGNETMTAHQIVLFLNKTNFDIYADHWNEQDLYFGRHHQKVMDIDKLFGSEKFNLPADVSLLHDAARIILRSPIDPATFNQKVFLKSHTDIIAIERGLSEKMKKFWLPAPAPTPQ